MRILSISGGGIRGIVALTRIAKLEEQLGKRVQEEFDLIIGTSTGAIIACAYGCGFKTSEILDLYINHASDIFYRDTLWKIRSGWGILDSKYKSDKLHELLKTYFGERKLSETIIPIITTAYNTVISDVKLFKSLNKEKYTVVDAAMASSAAPTIFPPYRIATSEEYIDGGIFANNPAIIAIGELMKDNKYDSCVSIGTGTVISDPNYTKGWGIKEWLIKDKKKPLIDMIFESQKQVNVYVSNLFGSVHYDVILDKYYAIDETDRNTLLELFTFCNKQNLTYE